MTRKHFKALARKLRQVKPLITLESMENFIQWKMDVEAVTEACQMFNAQFDTERFKEACRYYE